MWVTNKLGKEQVWYEQDLITRIRNTATVSCLICCECTEDERVEQCGYRDILQAIQEFER